MDSPIEDYETLYRKYQLARKALKSIVEEMILDETGSEDVFYDDDEEWKIALSSVLGIILIIPFIYLSFLIMTLFIS